MLQRWVCSVVMVAGLAVALSAPAFAAGRSDLAEPFRKEVAKSEVKLAELQAQLEEQQLSNGKYAPATLDAYLVQCNWLVYGALGAYEFDNLNTYTPPADLQVLVGPYLKAWPLNPLHNWEPVRVLALADGFSPGDFVLQRCPPEFYSFVGSIEQDNRQPLSYELGIYGATPDCAPRFDVSDERYNTWRTVPEGILFMLGSYTETAAQSLEKRQRRAERLAREAAEKAK